MTIDLRIDSAIRQAFDVTAGDTCPGGLARAMEYAVFPGGHRLRPRLCLAVAMAQESQDSRLVDAAMASIELLHCASLVHDDMPCFDNAEFRRGKPSVHVAFGEPLGLLCGDALIVRAFQVLAEAAQHGPRRAANILMVVSAGVGAPRGIVAGQAWECESERRLADYQAGKTGALFAAATMAGAASAGVPHTPWSALGESMGSAYQVADDLLDRFGKPELIGKPVGRDALLERSNAVAELGVDAATRRLEWLIEEMLDTIPDCPGRDDLRQLIHHEATRFTDRALRARNAA